MSNAFFVAGPDLELLNGLHECITELLVDRFVYKDTLDGGTDLAGMDKCSECDLSLSAHIPNQRPLDISTYLWNGFLKVYIFADNGWVVSTTFETLTCIERYYTG